MRGYSPRNLVAVLASMLTASKPGGFSRVVLFLGAGAPRGAGLPLADELKWSVAQDVFGADVPEAIANGRLEDVMELFHTMGRENGYELVAQKIRKYAEFPRCYTHIADFVRRNYVEAIVTTNFDTLLDNLHTIVPVDLTVLSSDSAHANQDVPHGSTIVSKLHGSAEDPATMRGAWTDVRELPEAKAQLLQKMVGSFPTIFVGWAALDEDIIKVLKEVIHDDSPPRIFWVDPTPTPTEHIQQVLDWFGSTHNYISLTADEFFESLHDHIFPTPEPNAGKTTHSEIARRISRSAQSVDLRARQIAKQMREDYRHRVHGRIRSFLGSLKGDYGPKEDDWLVSSKAFNTNGIKAGDWAELVDRLSRGNTEKAHPALQIRAGGPALTLFIGWEYRDDGDVIELTALLALHERSKISTGTPLPPLTVQGGSMFTVQWGSEASFKELEAWLEGEVRSIFLPGLEALGDAIAGRTGAPQ